MTFQTLVCLDIASLGGKHLFLQTHRAMFFGVSWALPIKWGKCWCKIVVPSMALEEVPSVLLLSSLFQGAKLFSWLHYFMITSCLLRHIMTTYCLALWMTRNHTSPPFNLPIGWHLRCRCAQDNLLVVGQLPNLEVCSAFGISSFLLDVLIPEMIMLSSVQRLQSLHLEIG